MMCGCRPKLSRSEVDAFSTRWGPGWDRLSVDSLRKIHDCITASPLDWYGTVKLAAVELDKLAVVAVYFGCHIGVIVRVGVVHPEPATFKVSERNCIRIANIVSVIVGVRSHVLIQLDCRVLKVAVVTSNELFEQFVEFTVSLVVLTLDEVCLDLTLPHLSEQKSFLGPTHASENTLDLVHDRISLRRHCLAATMEDPASRHPQCACASCSRFTRELCWSVGVLTIF